MKRADTKMMKELNKNLVRNIFRVQVQVTSANLSNLTGLSVVTVNALLKEMVNDNEVFVDQTIPSNGGRPSTVYKYNAMFRCAAIIYGYTKNHVNYINVLVTNLLGNCIYEKESIFETIVDESFDECLDTLMKKYPAIEVIAFGLPGAEEDGVITLNDYPAIIGDTFLKHYKERYEVPVLFINDINAAVHGYYHHKLDNSNDQTVVGLVFNRTHVPGSGIVVNGEVHTGKSNFAGEISYMPLGIDWLNLNYHDSEEISEAIAKVISMISCVIAPDQFVIYGDFFNENSTQLIKLKADKLLQNYFETNVVVCDDFEDDYKQGMIKSVFDVLKNTEKEMTRGI